MALTLRNSFPTESGAAPLLIAKPTGTATNDLLLLLIVTASDVIPTAPGGFQLVAGAQITGTTCTSVFQKIADSAEPDNYWVNWPSGNGSVGMVAIDSSTLDFPAVHQVATASSGSANTDKTWAQVTNTDTNTLLLCFGGFGSSAASTPHSGMTERWDTSNPRIYLMTEAVASSGATGTRTATGSSVATQRCITISVTESSVYPITYPAEIDITSLPVYVEMEGEGIDITSLPVLVEFGAIGVYMTALPVLIEIEFEPTGFYAVADGHDIPASLLARLDPQPASAGVKITRRDHSGNQQAHQDDALYIEVIYSALGSVAEYQAVLTAWGLLSAIENEITLTARSSRQAWTRWNGTAVRPQMQQDARWENFFPRGIVILVKNVSEAA